MSWQEVARDIGGERRGAHRISASTITRTARGGVMEADGVLAMIRWLGLRFNDFTPGAPKTNPVKTGPQRGRFDPRAFYEALDTERRSRKLTWKQLALEFPGHSPGMLTRLSMGGRMGVGQVVILSAWLGRAPEDFAHITSY